MPAQVVLPIGIHLDEPPPTLEEGYEVHWRDDDDPSHYFFVAHVSALRLERIPHLGYGRFAVLPEHVHDRQLQFGQMMFLRHNNSFPTLVSPSPNRVGVGYYLSRSRVKGSFRSFFESESR